MPDEITSVSENDQFPENRQLAPVCAGTFLLLTQRICNFKQQSRGRNGELARSGIIPIQNGFTLPKIGYE